MARNFVHTCLRVRDERASVAFYESLGFEERGRLNFDSAYNVYLGLPGDGDTLELTVNLGQDEPYEQGEAFSHIAITVDDIDAAVAALAERGIEPEKPPFHPGGREDVGPICFVSDPDGNRVELIDGGGFATPQDPPHPAAR